MISVNMSTVGQALPPHYEVVWNGSMDRDWAKSYQTAPPPEPIPRSGPPNPAHSQFLAYLQDHRLDLHDSVSIAGALGVSQAHAAHWLGRAYQRGIIRAVAVIQRGGRPGRIYQVVG